jgi:hypothetical protein
MDAIALCSGWISDGDLVSRCGAGAGAGAGAARTSCPSVASLLRWQGERAARN